MRNNKVVRAYSVHTGHRKSRAQLQVLTYSGNQTAVSTTHLTQWDWAHSHSRKFGDMDVNEKSGLCSALCGAIERQMRRSSLYSNPAR